MSIEKQSHVHHYKPISEAADHEASKAYLPEARFALTQSGLGPDAESPFSGARIDKTGITFLPNTLEGRQHIQEQRAEITKNADEAKKFMDAAKTFGSDGPIKKADLESITKNGANYLNPDIANVMDAAKYMLDHWKTAEALGAGDSFNAKDPKTQQNLDQINKAAADAEKNKTTIDGALTAKDSVLEAGKIRKGEGPFQMASRLYEAMYGLPPKSAQDMAQVRNIGRALVKTMQHEGKVFKVGEGLNEKNFQDFLKNME